MQNFQKRNFSGLVVRKDISWILKEIEEPIKQALGKNISRHWVRTEQSESPHSKAPCMDISQASPLAQW